VAVSQKPAKPNQTIQHEAMKRLSIALSVLLLLNLLTEGLRWLLAANLLPLANLWLTALVVLGMVVLTYFATLSASPLAYLYAKEAKVYAAAGCVGFLLGLL